MSLVKLLGYDLDGTLIDTRDQLCLIDIGVIEQFTGKRWTLQEYYKIFTPSANWFDHYAMFGIKEKNLQQKALKMFFERERTMSPIKLIPGVMETIAYAAALGLRQHLITRHDGMDAVRNKLSQTGLGRYFNDGNVTVTDRDKEKEIRDVYKKYDVEPGSMIFVSDTAHDIEQGNRAGVRTVAISNPASYNSREQLEKSRRWRMIADIRDLKELIHQ